MESPSAHFGSHRTTHSLFLGAPPGRDKRSGGGIVDAYLIRGGLKKLGNATENDSDSKFLRFRLAIGWEHQRKKSLKLGNLRRNLEKEENFVASLGRNVTSNLLP